MLGDVVELYVFKLFFSPPSHDSLRNFLVLTFHKWMSHADIYVLGGDPLTVLSSPFFLPFTWQLPSFFLDIKIFHLSFPAWSWPDTAASSAGLSGDKTPTCPVRSLLPDAHIDGLFRCHLYDGSSPTPCLSRSLLFPSPHGLRCPNVVYAQRGDYFIFLFRHLR